MGIKQMASNAKKSDSKKLEKTHTEKNKGGRPKGALNKNTQHLFDLLEEHGTDPALILIHIMNNNWKALGYPSPEIERQGFQGVVSYEDRISLSDRADAAKTYMSFVYSKKKAVEHTVDKESVKTLTFQYIEPKNDKP
jgi:hypothetical protein